jgi:hypothetical protein
LFTNPPYLYGIANFQPGEVPTGFDRKVKQSDLATVDTTVNSTGEARVFKMLSAVGPSGDGGWARVIRLDVPRTIRYYVDQTPYGWSGTIEQDTDGSEFPFGDWRLEGDPVIYKTGRHYQERWNAAAFGPSVFAYTARSADQMNIYLNSLADADGHGGSVATTSASTTLYRDGTEIGSTDGFGIGATGLPAGEASYNVVATRTQDVLPFSTRVDLEATFTSSADRSDIAIHTVGFQPDVDGSNTMVRKPVTVLPFTAEGVKQVKVQYSDDGGATWKQAPVAGNKAIFPTPAGNTVSLRSTATDAAGNSTTQTVIAAYTMR